MTSHAPMADLAPLYALDALEADERIGFERHVDGCESCVSEIALACEVAAALVPDSSPPPGVWERIIGKIEGTRPSTVARLSDRTDPARSWRRVPAIAAAVAFVVAGVAIVRSQQPLTTEQALEAAARSASAAEGAIEVSLVVDGSTVARVVLTEDGQGFLLPTDLLPVLEAERTYQLWVINDDGRVISAGVLGSAPGPSSFTWSDGVSGLALTREVAGGVEISEGDVVAVVTDI